MQKWQRIPCGYGYDSAEGDAEGGIPAGTAFAGLADGWVCTICGAGKNPFENMA